MLRKIFSLLRNENLLSFPFQPRISPAGGFPSGPSGEIRTYSTLFGLPGPAGNIGHSQAGLCRGQPGDIESGFIRHEPVFSCHPHNTIGHELMLNNSSELLGGRKSPMLHHMHDELLLKSILALNLSRSGENGLAFIHVAPETLDHALVSQLPAQRTVLAFQPDVAQAGKLLERCRALKNRGFRFALDNFTYSPGLYPLLGLVDFVRFDINRDSLSGLGQQLEQIPRLNDKTLIARNVNSEETYNIATLLSFRHFQGSYPEKAAPEGIAMISSRQARIIVLMNMLKNRAESSEIVDTMQQDAALSTHVLHHVNSPANGTRQEVHSITEALSAFGHDAIYRWLCLLLFSSNTPSCHQDSIVSENALLRGRLTELFGQRNLSAGFKVDLFATGMLSCLDRLFRLPLDQALGFFSLSTPTGDALLQQRGPHLPFLNLAIACENHNQPEIEHHARLAGISIEQVNAIYVKALVWVHEIENQPRQH